MSVARAEQAALKSQSLHCLCAHPCREHLPKELIAAGIRSVRLVPTALWLPPLLRGDRDCLQLAAAMMQVELLWERLPAAEPLHTLGQVVKRG